MNTSETPFIWRDLSSFNPATTRRFYTAVLGWSFEEADGYAYASAAGGQVAGLYEMPDKFRKIGMPSFWMSYIAVTDIAAVVETARAHGGRVEIDRSPFGGGHFALIRDPSGAGFTIYNGPPLAGDVQGHGAPCGHDLYVADAALVAGFYKALFGWRFIETGGAFDIFSGDKRIARCYQVPDAERGKEQYWAVNFAVADLDTARAVISEHGGSIIAMTETVDGPTLVAADPDGGTFFLRQAGAKSARGPVKWYALGGLTLIFAGVLLNLPWLWGVFLGVWTIQAVRDGKTYLFEDVSRAETPTLYWIIVAVFAALTVLSFIPGES